jgi:DMSO reductase family type II enzyme chaperone
MSAPVTSVTSERSVSAARDEARTAPARCRCYGAFSELLASPHDVDVREALPARAGATDGLPFAFALDELMREHAGHDVERLKSEYSALFEVGSQGPPAPIREDLQTGQKAGTREDLVRFYDYFGYRLGERFAWAPDHLSVELECMHYLCFHEATAAEDRRSWQLAQADFAERHLQNWVPQLAAAATRLAPGSFYDRVLAALADFVARDLVWQGSTIE